MSDKDKLKFIFLMIKNEKLILRTIWGASIIVPLAVAIILNPSFPRINVGFDTTFLPPIYASINAIVAVLLSLGFYFIRQKDIQMHRNMMLGAFGLSILFLLLYILYHLTNGHTIYQESCGLVPKSLYLFVLYTHIGLSGIIIPLASFSIFRALSEKYDKHRKIAKITLPLWLYVAVSGVAVYGMISSCYAN